MAKKKAGEDMLSSEEVEEILNPPSDGSPYSGNNKRLECNAKGCETHFQIWKCRICKQFISDKCPACHKEFEHGKIPPPRIITATPPRMRHSAGHKHIAYIGGYRVIR